jgi:hypothetical protein
MPVLKARIGGAWVDVGGSSASEVEVSATDPIAANPAAEMWYDTADTGISLPNGPRGWVGYVEGPLADVTGITSTPADITGLTLTFTADPTRRYKTTFRVSILKTGGAGNCAVDLADAGGTQVERHQLPTLALNDAVTIVGSHVETGLSGSITRKLRALTGGTTVTIWGTTFWQRGFLLVEDIGGV